MEYLKQEGLLLYKEFETQTSELKDAWEELRATTAQVEEQMRESGGADEGESELTSNTCT